MQKKLLLLFLPILFLPFHCLAQTDLSIIYASYFGGNGNEHYINRGLDTRIGNWLSGITTTSSNMPVTANAFQSEYNGDYDIFLSIFEDSGALTYASYFGGSNDDHMYSMRFLPGIDGFAISGFTESIDFPVTPGAYLSESQGGGLDGFVSRFAENGDLLWSTYFGGSGIDRIYDMAVDSSGSIYIVGHTFSPGIATSGVHQTEYNESDAFLAKFDSLGALLWCTYFGDTGVDYFGSVNLSPDGTSVICGGITQSNQNMANGGWQDTFGGITDALIASFNTADGTLNWSSYYGGEYSDKCFTVLVGDSGEIYMAGSTNSVSNIATAGAHQETAGGSTDDFLVRFDADGNREWATYFGGDDTEGFPYLMLQNGNVVMHGFSNSQNNIVFGNPMDSVNTDNADYMVKFDSTGQIIWGTYFLSDRDAFIGALKPIPGGLKMVAAGIVMEGVGMSDIITPNAYQMSSGGETDLAFYVFEDNALSSKTHELTTLKVYPNPATDMVTIERPENLTGDLYLEVFDTTGKLVLGKWLYAGNSGINVSKLGTGGYILKVNSEREFFRTKLIVQ